MWRSKVIQGLASDFKTKGRSTVKVQKEKVDSVLEQQKKVALAAMKEEDPEDQNHGGALSKTTTMNAKINMLKMKKQKMKKKKAAIESLQAGLSDSVATRPLWNTSMMFPYRYKHMEKDQIPPLGRMFKPMSFWKRGCNPKVNVPRQPESTCHKTQRQHLHRHRLMRQSLQQGTNIATFTKQAQLVSSQFRRHTRRPGMSAPTPEVGGFYIPPSPRKGDAGFPQLNKFFEGGKFFNRKSVCVAELWFVVVCARGANSLFNCFCACVLFYMCVCFCSCMVLRTTRVQAMPKNWSGPL